MRELSSNQVPPPDRPRQPNLAPHSAADATPRHQADRVHELLVPDGKILPASTTLPLHKKETHPSVTSLSGEPSDIKATEPFSDTPPQLSPEPALVDAPDIPPAISEVAVFTNPDVPTKNETEDDDLWDTTDLRRTILTKIAEGVTFFHHPLITDAFLTLSDRLADSPPVRLEENDPGEFVNPDKPDKSEHKFVYEPEDSTQPTVTIGMLKTTFLPYDATVLQRYEEDDGSRTEMAVTFFGLTRLQFNPVNQHYPQDKNRPPIGVFLECNIFEPGGEIPTATASGTFNNAMTGSTQFVLSERAGTNHFPSLPPKESHGEPTVTYDLVVNNRDLPRLPGPHFIKTMLHNDETRHGETNERAEWQDHRPVDPLLEDVVPDSPLAGRDHPAVPSNFPVAKDRTPPIESPNRQSTQPKNPTAPLSETMTTPASQPPRNVDVFVAKDDGVAPERDKIVYSTAFLFAEGPKIMTTLSSEEIYADAQRLAREVATEISPETDPYGYLSNLAQRVRGRKNHEMMQRVFSGIDSPDPKVNNAARHALVVLNTPTIRTAVDHVMTAYSLPEGQRDQLTRAAVDAVYQRAHLIAAQTNADAKNRTATYVHHAVTETIVPPAPPREHPKPQIITKGYTPTTEADAQTAADRRRLLATVTAEISGQREDRQRILEAPEEEVEAGLRHLVNIFNTHAQTLSSLSSKDRLAVDRLGKFLEGLNGGWSKPDLLAYVGIKNYYDFTFKKLIDFLIVATENQQDSA